MKRLLGFGILGFLATGCFTPQTAIPVHEPVRTTAASPLSAKPIPATKSNVQQVQATTNTPSDVLVTKPNYTQLETLPIDLSTVIRLVDEQSPVVAFAQAKVREAEANLEKAEVQWLPNLTVGMAYNRFDGQTQNQRGEIFSVSRANLFGGGGPALAIDTSEAIFRPLIQRRLTSAEQRNSQAVSAQQELDAVSGYLDLLQLTMALEINAQTVSQAQEMLKAALNAKEAKLDRSAGDVNRAQSEVLIRQAERLDLQAKAASASARLSRLLLLPPNVKLVPGTITVAPITLIDPNSSLDQLIEIALNNRPDLAASRDRISAAWTKVRQQQTAPLMPKVVVANQTGSFGGGLDSDLRKFDTRNALSVQLFWEVRNLGFGNRADVREKRAQLDQANYQLLDSQAKASADIVEAAAMAVNKAETLELAQQAVKEATELYRINKDGTSNLVDTKNLFDALRPLQAIQLLHNARQQYLTAVIDYNRSQFRLFTLLGNPVREANREQAKSN